MRILLSLFLFSLFLSGNVFSEPRMKYVLKAEGSGKYTTGADGRQYCTHDKSLFSFTTMFIN